MKIIVDGRAWLRKEDLTSLQLSTLKESLTIIPKKMGDDDVAPIDMWVETDDLIGIPRSFFEERKREIHDVEYRLTEGDKSSWPGDLTFNGTLRPAQQTAMDDITNKFVDAGLLGGILKAVPGFGKCLAPNTEVVTYDGSLVQAKDVVAGDLLMGPDSKPRYVVGTTKGKGQMYRIVPKKGDPWECNDVHVLTLVHSLTGEIRDIPLDQYLQLSDSDRHYLKLFQPEGPIRFSKEMSLDECPIDPYFLGVWYGDGTKLVKDGKIAKAAVTTVDPKIVSLMEDTASKWDLYVRKEEYGGKCPTYHLSKKGRVNTLIHALRTLYNGDDSLPKKYITASPEVRWAFLAGLIDSDGDNVRGTYEIVQKRKNWAKDISFLARSLGLKAILSEKVVNGTSYWRVHIHGDLTQAPLRLARKIHGTRKQKKRPGRTGFDVIALGEGDYAGFELDGDSRFLLGDFTVTHNTVCSAWLIAKLNVPTLVIVHKEFLRDQWIARLEQFLPGVKIGLCQQDKCEFEGNNVVIGMVHSLTKIDKYPEEFKNWPGLVITDEMHRIGAPTWAPVPSYFPARYRFGVSATPKRKDGADNVFYYNIGRVLHASKEQRMTPKIRRVWTNFNFPKSATFNPNTISRSILLNILTRSKSRNELIAEQIELALKAGRKVLVLSERLDHLRDFEKRAENFKTPPSIGWYVGGVTPEQRKQAEDSQLVLATVQYACVDVDTPIVDPISGESFTIRNGKGRVISGTGDCSVVLPEAGQVSGVKECVRITLKGGKQLVVSEDHLMWTTRGWVEAGALVAGSASTDTDYLAYPATLEVPEQETDLTVDDAWLLGLLIGDGSMSCPHKGQFELTSADEDIVKEADRILKNRGNKTWLRRIVEDKDLARTAEDKMFPEEIVAGPLPVVASALGGFFDADGTTSKRRGEISFSSNSRRLLEQTRTMLLRLGIPVLHDLTPDKTGNIILRIPECLSEDFMEKIDSRLLRKKVLPTRTSEERVSLVTDIPPVYVEALKKELKVKGVPVTAAIALVRKHGYAVRGLRTAQSGLALGAYRLICEEYSLTQEANPTLLWRRVTRIEKVGPREVGDLAVPPRKSWVFSGAIVHNSEGMDIPPLDTLFITTPMSDVEQAVGRILRPHADKKPPIVVDIRDDKVARFKKNGKSRDRYYKSIGADT